MAVKIIFEITDSQEGGYQRGLLDIRCSSAHGLVPPWPLRGKASQFTFIDPSLVAAGNCPEFPNLSCSHFLCLEIVFTCHSLRQLPQYWREFTLGFWKLIRWC